MLVSWEPFGFGFRRADIATADLARKRSEAGDIVSQVMSFGSNNPVEVAVQGPALPLVRAHAEKVRAELAKVDCLRDLQFAQPSDYPTLEF